jgi:hypothetical protein
LKSAPFRKHGDGRCGVYGVPEILVDHAQEQPTHIGGNPAAVFELFRWVERFREQHDAFDRRRDHTIPVFGHHQLSGSWMTLLDDPRPTGANLRRLRHSSQVFVEHPSQVPLRALT